MKVFLSWSGTRSKKAAEFMAEWLPQVIQAVEPWISIDIAKGSRWNPEISKELEVSRVGIIFLTPENLNEKWILFEAGALSKIRDTQVYTFLLGLNPTDIEAPLSQFQHTIFKKEDVFRLIQTVNQQLGSSKEKPLSEKTLTLVFERFWPEFDEKIKKIISSTPKKKEQIRTDRDILEELLEIMRRQDQLLVPFEATDTGRKAISIAKRKYARLVKEFGVRPEEARESVLKEIMSTIPLAFENYRLIESILCRIDAEHFDLDLEEET
jgi:hypothetical protein